MKTQIETRPLWRRSVQRMVSRAGGITQKTCPKCGGRVVLSDGYPSIKPQYRYMIACDEHDCEAVCGPTVRAVVKMWNAACAANVQAEP